MADLFCEWQGDFLVDPTGDLFVTHGDVETRQRLERRLFTAVRGYVWHKEYGAGLPQKIGDPWSVQQIQSVVASQVALEAAVAPSPPAQVRTIADPNEPGKIGISIKYWDAATGISVSFDIAPTIST